ncbi:MAG TPA: hypothetical protein VFJ91_07665, partial [Gaiellaceae bacterium]|nr:hypothetical protein [Gaiellaceae bacterium]
GGTKGKPAGGSKRRGGASAGGTTGFSSSSPSSYSSGSSQPTSSYVGGSGDVAAAQPVSSPTGSTQQSIPQAFVSALRKPVWLLVAYLVWQALVIATGASLWSWRKGGTA